MTKRAKNFCSSWVEDDKILADELEWYSEDQIEDMELDETFETLAGADFDLLGTLATLDNMQSESPYFIEVRLILLVVPANSLSLFDLQKNCRSALRCLV